MPQVSVLLPSYNYACYLEAAVESVIQQSFKDWELIIIDDGSSDNSLEIAHKCARLDPRIRVASHQSNQNLGLAKTYQLGLTLSKGELIAFLESDDELMPNSLESRVKLLDQEPELSIVYTDAELIVETGIPDHRLSFYDKLLSWSRILASNPLGRKEYPLIFLDQNIIFTFSVTMVRAAHLRQVSFDVPREFQCWLDRWLWGQLSVFGPVQFLDEKLTYWRLHNNSYSHKTTPSLSSEGKENFHNLLKSLMYEKAKTRSSPLAVAIKSSRR